MLRGDEAKPFNVAIKSDFGGLGDEIARLPALKHLLQIAPHVNVFYYAPNYLEEYIKTVLQHPRLVVRNRDAFHSGIKNIMPVIHFAPFDITSLKRHLVEYAFNIMCDMNPPSKDAMRYLPTPSQTKPGGLPDKYVVVTTGYTAPARAWLAEHINAYCKWAVQKGYMPVFLGDTNINTAPGVKVDAFFQDTIDFSVGVDLRGKTSILQATAVLEHAELVVGVDNGLLHIAATTNTPIVMGFTTLLPEHRLPVRDNIATVVPNIKCGGCQSRMHYINHDFRTCYYKDYACLSEMTSDKFIQASERFI